MMGTFLITVQGDAPKLLLGADVGGAKVIEIKDVSPDFVSPQELAEKYGYTEQYVRNRLASINKGIGKKHKYKPEEAHLILGQKEKRVGRSRNN